MIDGDAYGLNKGLLGFGSDNSRGMFDNVQLRTLPAQLTLDRFDNFSDGVADWLDDEVGTPWVAASQQYNGTAASGLGVSLVDLPQIAYDAYLAARHDGSPGNGGPRSRLRLLRRVRLQVRRGRRRRQPRRARPPHAVRMGRRPVGRRSTWSTATATPSAVSLRGASVSVVVDGQTLISFGYNSAVVDGRFGLLIKGVASETASFDDVRVRTNDTQFNEYNPGTAQVTITDATIAEGASGQHGRDVDDLAQPTARGNGDGHVVNRSRHRTRRLRLRRRLGHRHVPRRARRPSRSPST